MYRNPKLGTLADGVCLDREDSHEVVVPFEFEHFARARWDAGVTDPGVPSVLYTVGVDDD